MSAITITRNDHDTAGFLGAAAASQDADAARRMLVLALVLDGASRADAASACGMDRHLAEISRQCKRRCKTDPPAD